MTLSSFHPGSIDWRRMFAPPAWLFIQSRQTVAADLKAGLTGAIVILPQGVALATIAGMPPQYGLYAAMIPAIVAALFGSSWHLVSGPTTAASLVLFAGLSNHAVPGSLEFIELAITLSLMVGLLELTLGIFRLGSIVNFVSHSVIIGFTAGAAILIGTSQLQNLTGIPVPGGSNAPRTWAHIVQHARDISWPIASVGVVTIIAGLINKRYLPFFPYMISAIVAGSLYAAGLKYFAGQQVSMVGELPVGLPPLSMPSFDIETWRLLAPTAFAMTMFALTEAISISRALAVRSGQHISANQEFVGQGLSNCAGAFFSGYVATGSFNRSAANYEAGARTPLSAILAGIFLMGISPFVAPLTAHMPLAAMAGVLILVAVSLIDVHHVAKILRTSKSDSAVLITTFASTLLIELEFAIFAGVILSLLLYLNKASHPQLVPRVPDPMSATRKFTEPRMDLPECPQFHVARLDGSLFFGAANAFKEDLRAQERASPQCKHLAIVMSGVNFIDVSGAEALVAEAKRIRERGGSLYLIRMKESAYATLARGGYLDDIGRDRIFRSKTDALRMIYRHLDYDMCRRCDLRVYVECARLGKQEPLLEDEDFWQDTMPEAAPPAKT
ncbi:MAG: SulP family inorganic anion transporter [Beijerinckiaceae bacterium]